MQRLTKISRARVLAAALLGFALAWCPVLEARSSTDDDGGQLTAYKAAKIYTAAEPAVLEDAFLVVRGGKVVGIAKDAPAGADIVDLGEAVIIPGLVAADSAISSRASDRSPNAVGGPDTAAPHYRAIDGFDMYADQSALLRAGITTAYVAPGRNRLIGGQGAVVKLGGDESSQRVLDEQADLFVNLSAAALGPPASWDPPVQPSAEDPLLPVKPQRPASRAAMAIALRELVAEAARYRAGRAKPVGERPAYDPQLEACAGLGSLDVRLVCRRADDILRALEIQRTMFSARRRHVYLCGAAEAHKLADQIAAAKLPVVLEVESLLGRIAPNVGDKAPALDYDASCAAKLAAAGVRVAIVAKAPEAAGQPQGGTTQRIQVIRGRPIRRPSRGGSSSGPRGGDLTQLRLLAGQAIRAGLSAQQALSAVTVTAAEILGVDRRVGSLRAGRDADFVVLNGEPFHLASSVLATYIDGERVYRAPRAAEERPGAGAVVRAGRILTGCGEVIENGEVLVIDGRIAEVGTSVGRPEGFEVIDYGPQAVITPGFIDARSGLGLEGISASIGLDDSLAEARHRRVAGARELALAGVTSVLVCPSKLDARGAPMGAFKSFLPAGSWQERTVSELAAIRFSVEGDNRTQALDSLRSALKRGKEYHGKWLEYEAAYAKWLAEGGPQKAAEKKPAEAKKSTAKKEEKKEPEKKEGKAAAADVEADPLSGTWDGEIEDFPDVGYVVFKAKLELDGETVSGTIATPVLPGPPLPLLEGSFKDGAFHGEIEVPEVGRVKLDAKVDAGAMKGAITVGDLQVEFTARRTDVPEARIERVYKPSKAEKKSSSTSSKDGSPKKPKLDPKLEPFRRVFRGELPLVVDCKRRDEIESALKILTEEYAVPAVLSGAEEYGHVAGSLRAAKPGVALSGSVMIRERGMSRVPAADLSRMGLAVAFESGASDGARTLPLVAAWAVHHGFSPGDALAALTHDAACIFGLEDRIGSVAPGRDADLVIFSGAPFDLASEIVDVYVRGRKVARVERAWR